MTFFLSLRINVYTLEIIHFNDSYISYLHCIFFLINTNIFMLLINIYQYILKRLYRLHIISQRSQQRDIPSMHST